MQENVKSLRKWHEESILPGYLDPLKMEELWSFEMSEISHPRMQVHIPAEQIPLPCQCENLKTHKMYHTQSHKIYLVEYHGYMHYYVFKLHISRCDWTKRALRHFPEKLMFWNPNWIKVQCKEVKNTTSLLSVIMLLIERHVSAYSEAIIKFNKC